MNTINFDFLLELNSDKKLYSKIEKATDQDGRLVVLLFVGAVSGNDDATFVELALQDGSDRVLLRGPHEITSMNGQRFLRFPSMGQIATDKQALEGAELGYPEGTNEMFAQCGWPDKIYVIKKKDRLS